MTFLEYAALAWEALLLNRMRSVLTMLGIIFGVASVVAILAIGSGTEAVVVREVEGLGTDLFQVLPKVNEYNGQVQRIESFTEQDIRRVLQQVPEVEQVMYTLNQYLQVKYQNRSTVTKITGAFPEWADMTSIKVSEGRWFSEDENRSGARVVVIGSEVTERLFEQEPALGKRIRIQGYSYQVIGVVEKDTGLLAQLFGAPNDDRFFIPVQTFKNATGMRDIFMLNAVIRPGAELNATMLSTVQVLENLHTNAQFEARSVKQFAAMLGKITSVITGVMSAVAAISLIVGGVGIMNIMLVSVSERTREIGVRKALGARHEDILMQFLIEAVLVSVVGGLVGVLVAALPVWGVGRWLNLPLTVNWVSVIRALLFAVAVGVVFGVYPANKAARMDPIQALRYE
jgi:putative ABC transport system permease protein